MSQENIEDKITHFTSKWGELFGRITDQREYSALSYSTVPDKSLIGVLWRATYHDPCLVKA